MALAELQPIAISDLQHFAYCPRQFALIHLDQVWSDNYFTAQGNVLHERVGSQETEVTPPRPGAFRFKKKRSMNALFRTRSNAFMCNSLTQRKQSLGMLNNTVFRVARYSGCPNISQGTAWRSRPGRAPGCTSDSHRMHWAGKILN